MLKSSCCVYSNPNIYSTPISLSLTLHSIHGTHTQLLMCSTRLLPLIQSALLMFVWTCFGPVLGQPCLCGFALFPVVYMWLQWHSDFPCLQTIKLTTRIRS